MGRRADANLKADLQLLLQIDGSEELGAYLGVPVTAGMPRLKHFDTLRSRIVSKLSGWRAKSLSFFGRPHLLEKLFIIANAISHPCPLPCSAGSWRSAQLRAFLWNHSADERRWHGWECFLASRSEGGAGLLDIEQWYEALSRKQAIRVRARKTSVKQILFPPPFSYLFMKASRLSRSGPSSTQSDLLVCPL